MAIQLTAETGTGAVDANSYCSVEQADAFHATNPHTMVAWAALTTNDKAAALIAATRILDAQYSWHGYKLTALQALKWPRGDATDPDQAGGRDYFLTTEIPAALVRCTALLAAELMVANPEADAQGKGMSSFSLEGVLSVAWDKSDTKGIIPDHIATELSALGSLGSAGARLVKLIRV